jgi:ribosomal protein L10
MPGKKAIKKSRGQKIAQWEGLQEACKKYNKCLFVDVDNVTSKQICIMRRQLREMDSLMFMGKNVSF